MSSKSNLPAKPDAGRAPATAKERLAARRAEFAQGIANMRRNTGTPESRTLSCLCAQDGRRFVSIFERYSPQERFRFARAEPCADPAEDSGAGSLLGSMPLLKVFSSAEFDFSGWNCHFCGDARGFVDCGCDCGFVCKARTVSRGAAQYFYCHPGCGSAGPLVGAATISGRTGGGARPLGLPARGSLLSGPVLPRLGGPRK